MVLPVLIRGMKTNRITLGLHCKDTRGALVSHVTRGALVSHVTRGALVSHVTRGALVSHVTRVHLYRHGRAERGEKAVSRAPPPKKRGVMRPRIAALSSTRFYQESHRGSDGAGA